MTIPGSDRLMSLALAGALLLVPMQTTGWLDPLIRPAADRAVVMMVDDADSLGTAVPAASRTFAHRRAANRLRALLRREGGRVPSTDSLLPGVAIAHDASVRHNVPISIVLAVIYHESRFRQEAVSPVGAVGLMQVMPAVARSLARIEGLPRPARHELFDSRTNINTGVKLLRRLHDRYGSWELALAHYNAGHRAFVNEGIRSDVRVYVRRVHREAEFLRTRMQPPPTV